MLNPFIICDVAQQRIYRAYADREAWMLQCRALGASTDALFAFDASASRYAMTTPYPNSDVVAYLRQLAREALARGEPMPRDAEMVLETEHQRRLRSIAGRFR